MAVIKTVNKDINRELLFDQQRAIGLTEHGPLWAGFTELTREIMTPSNIHGYPAGQLHYRERPPMGPALDAALDGVLAAHDPTQRSVGQVNRAKDEVARQLFIETFNNWDTLTNAQRMNRFKHLFRVSARLIDRTTDL